MVVVGYIADIAGLLSFCISIVLWIITEKTRNEMKSQRDNYANEGAEIKKNLAALRINILEDDLQLSRKIVSEIRENIYLFQQKYFRLIRNKDRTNIRRVDKLLDAPPESINRDSLCKLLDYFVTRFERRES